jgi:hypothetical protein
MNYNNCEPAGQVGMDIGRVEFLKNKEFSLFLKFETLILGKS